MSEEIFSESSLDLREEEVNDIYDDKSKDKSKKGKIKNDKPTEVSDLVTSKKDSSKKRKQNRLLGKKIKRIVFKNSLNIKIARTETNNNFSKNLKQKGFKDSAAINMKEKENITYKSPFFQENRDDFSPFDTIGGLYNKKTEDKDDDSSPQGSLIFEPFYEVETNRNDLNDPALSPGENPTINFALLRTESRKDSNGTNYTSKLESRSYLDMS